MKVHIEFLSHFQCDHCQLWWAIADRIPLAESVVYCPNGHRNHIQSVKSAIAYPEGIEVVPFDVTQPE